MKFYIVGRIGKSEEVKRIHELLREKGHEITYDWTKEGSAKPYEKNPEKSHKLSEKCLKAVRDCDVFIIISDEAGTHMYTELGFAILLNSLKNKPKIYVIGNYLNRSTFYFHKPIKRIRTIEEVFTDLKV